MNKVFFGDMLIRHEEIADGSVDLVLMDPPFGTIKGLDLSTWCDKKTAWDVAIDPVKIFTIANRILRKNGKLVLFSQEPYTTRLISEAIPNVPFCYRMIWKKNHFGNGLSAKKAPVSYYEDILVFSKNHQKYDFTGFHTLRPYFKSVVEFIGLPKNEIIKKIGQKVDHALRFDSVQFSLCTEKTYAQLTECYGLELMPGFRQFADLKAEDVKYRADLLQRMNAEFPATFNLWGGSEVQKQYFRICQRSPFPAPDAETYLTTRRPYKNLQQRRRPRRRPYRRFRKYRCGVPEREPEIYAYRNG